MTNPSTSLPITSRTKVGRLPAQQIVDPAAVILRKALDEVSMTVRTGPPGEDPADDEDHGVWAGVAPDAPQWAKPIASLLADPEAPLPASLICQRDPKVSSAILAAHP